MALDYRETLQITKTDFPMRGNLPQREPEIQRWWDELDIYSQVQARTKGRPKYVLHDGHLMPMAIFMLDTP